MERFIPLKKVELHIHLDGSVRHSTAWELAKIKGISIPGVSSYAEFKKACLLKRPSKLWDCLQPFNVFWPPFLGDLDAMERMAYEFCEDAHNAGIVYAEVRYSPALALGDKALKQVGPSGLDEVIKRVCNGLMRGEVDFGIMTRMILCARYSEHFNDLAETLQLCRSHHQDGVVGMDLLTLQPEHGVVDEAPVVEPVVSVFREAALTGVHRTIHAGEASDSKAVTRAYYELGSERIGHGYRVLEDEQLYRRCVQDWVHFEGCPYSSILSGSVKTGGSAHPIVRFAKDGANFSINSDDPTLTGHFVPADYQLLSSWGLTDTHFLQANINAATSSFLDIHSKKSLIKNLKNTQFLRKD